MQARSLVVGILLGLIIGGLAAIESAQLGLVPGTTHTVTFTSVSVETEYEEHEVYETVTSCVTSISTCNTSTVKWLSLAQEVVSYVDAGKYAGQTRTVEGTIVGTDRSSSNTVFLNFHDPYKGYFTVVIFSSDLSKFTFDPEKVYLHTEVRVTGQIQLYQGAPEIIVRSPSQIEVAWMGFNYP